jgi:hypothetical protein
MGTPRWNRMMMGEYDGLFLFFQVQHVREPLKPGRTYFPADQSIDAGVNENHPEFIIIDDIADLFRVVTEKREYVSKPPDHVSVVVVVSRNNESGEIELAQYTCRHFIFLRQAAIGNISCNNDDIRTLWHVIQKRNVSCTEAVCVDMVVKKATGRSYVKIRYLGNNHEKGFLVFDVVFT